MLLTLFPTRGLPSEPETTLSVAGDVLIVNGENFDLSALPEGGIAEADGDHLFVGPITRIDGEIRCSLIVLLGDDAVHHQPDSPWTVTCSEGAIALPVVRTKTEATT